MHCILDVSNPWRGKASWRLLLYLGRLVFRKMAGILWVLSCDLGHSGLCLGQLLTPMVKCNWPHAWSRDACLCCRFCSWPPAFVHTSLNLCTGLFISPLFSISFSFLFSFFLSFFLSYLFIFYEAWAGVAKIAPATRKSRKPRAEDLCLKFTLFTLNWIKYDWHLLASVSCQSEEAARWDEDSLARTMNCGLFWQSCIVCVFIILYWN